MDNAVTILATLLAFVLGYFAVLRFDRFLSEDGISDVPRGKKHKGVLIFGDAPETEKSLVEQGISYDVIDRAYLPDGCCYDTIIAVSSNDMDNIMLCTEAKHFWNISCTVAKCNDRKYHDIFLNSDVDKTVFNEHSAVALLLGQEVSP